MSQRKKHRVRQAARPPAAVRRLLHAPPMTTVVQRTELGLTLICRGPNLPASCLLALAFVATVGAGVFVMAVLRAPNPSPVPNLPWVILVGIALLIALWARALYLARQSTLLHLTGAGLTRITKALKCSPGSRPRA